MSTHTLHRRHVLQLLSAFAAGAAVGCRGCEDGSGGPPAGGETGPGGDDTGVTGDPLADYASVLRELQVLLRDAPDHRVGRAAALVAAGDASAILAFVRDHISWHPGEGVHPYNGSHGSALDREGAGQKYGARGALRSGGGSALDRALLLQQMLGDAGFSEVELAWFNLDAVRPDDPADLFLRDWARPEPGLVVPDDTWQRWSAALDLDLDAVVFDPEAEPSPDGEAEALADRLLAHFDDPAVPDWADECRWAGVGGAVPVVRFRDADGVARIANPALPWATLDDPGLDGSVEVDPPEEHGPLEVEVRLSVRTSHAPRWEDAQVLVEGAYTADQLVGRQLLVSTSPVTDATGLASIPAILHSTFQTALSVQALDGGEDVPEPVLGDAITLGGARVRLDEDGGTWVGGIQLSESSDGPRADPADVVDVRMEVDGSHFPAVFARVWPTDAAGALVEHLHADQLSLQDEARATPFVMQANRAAPRCALLRDTSLSMPAAYLDAAGDALFEQLSDAIAEAWPGASTTVEPTGSHIWTALANAASSEASVVVYLTDGDVADARTPAIEAALRAGPPAILVSVEGAIPDSLYEMAELSGGVVVSVDDPAALEAAVLDVLGTLDLPPYLLRWVVPGTEAGTRTAAVQVGGAAASADYEAVGENEPVRLMALDLELRVHGRTVRRTLAGWPSFRDYPEDREARDALHDEVRLAMLGGRMLSFEGEGPSASMALDDAVAVRLASIPLLQTADLDLDELLALVGQGFPSLPGPLLAAWEPLVAQPDTDSLTFPGAVRVAMVQVAPQADGHEWATLDLVDVSDWRTVTRSGDRREGFELNLARTARLALLEAGLGERSTLGLLGDAPLRELPDRPFIGELDGDLVARWEALLYGTRGVRIGPVDGTVLAYFHIDRDTGAVVAVMPDGSGGVQQILDVLAVLDAVIHLYCFVSASGPALSVVSAYGITLVRLYAAVATALEGFVTAGLDEAIRCALERFACEALARINAPPLLKAINRLCGLTLGVSLCSLYSRARGC